MCNLFKDILKKFKILSEKRKNRDLFCKINLPALQLTVYLKLSLSRAVTVTRVAKFKRLEFFKTRAENV